MEGVVDVKNVEGVAVVVEERNVVGDVRVDVSKEIVDALEKAVLLDPIELLWLSEHDTNVKWMVWEERQLMLRRKYLQSLQCLQREQIVH